MDATALAASLDGAADKLADTGPLLAAAAQEVARLAGPATPRRTGRLASSVQVVTETDRAGVRWGVGYAVYVNFGTRRMRAQPFATDALQAAETTIEQSALLWADTAVTLN